MQYVSLGSGGKLDLVSTGIVMKLLQDPPPSAAAAASATRLCLTAATQFKISLNKSDSDLRCNLNVQVNLSA